MTAGSALPPLTDGVTLCELGVDNLRALRMEQPVELRRLTLLAGRNGIGKSTFARVFPLLRQSAGRRKREPLLWWEHGEVDFGSFDEALRRNAEEMTFTFGFADADGTRWTARSVLGGGVDGSRVRRATVEQGDREFTLQLDDDGLPHSVAGRTAEDSFRATADDVDVLPLPQFDVDSGAFFGVPDDYLGPLPEVRFGLTDDPRALSPQFERFLKSLYPWGSEADFKPKLDREAKLVAEALHNPDQLARFRRANFCQWALERLRTAEGLIDELTKRTAYLGPFRAAPERAYRPQGVAVDRLDARGANLAMFLVALSDEERAHLNAELRAKLGFSVSVEAAGGRYSLHVELSDGRYNLVDVGYGYSQVLPVAVQLWASRRRLSTSRDPSSDAVVVIEQPELHLHPHQQVLMAQALAAFAADEGGPMQIIETHSDHLIGEIGMMIAKEKLDPAHVGVLCFEPHPQGGTSVRLASFHDDGVLHDWPVGFMSP